VRIKDWELNIGKHTLSLRAAPYAILALLVVLIAILLNKVLGYLDPAIKDHIDDILAILAILYAAIQFIDARLQKRETNEIAKSMSTRFVGLFPKNLTHITEVLGRGSKYIYIMSDFADYGSYSSPFAFEEYLKKIKDALKEKIPVRIMCYDKRRADDELKRQFPDEAFEQEKRSRSFVRYFDIRCGLEKCESAAKLREILNDGQNDVIKQLKDAGAEFRFFPDSAEFFLWLEDDEEAVFAFKDTGRAQNEFSFRTLDATLIRQFKSVFHRRWKACDPHTPKLKRDMESMQSNRPARREELDGSPATLQDAGERDVSRS
jgi:hypothetical protein